MIGLLSSNQTNLKWVLQDHSYFVLAATSEKISIATLIKHSNPMAS